jgi:hypothetical protein
MAAHLCIQNSHHNLHKKFQLADHFAVSYFECFSQLSTNRPIAVSICPLKKSQFWSVLRPLLVPLSLIPTIRVSSLPLFVFWTILRQQILPFPTPLF